MISLACADIPTKSYLNVFDCLRSSRIGRGKYVDRFEKLAAEYFGVEHAIAVSSGTLADTIMLMTLKELIPGKEEVIMPAFTFVAQANAVIMAGLKPIFYDINTVPFAGANTLCYFPAHLLGQYSPVVQRYDAPMLEDCCEAMGGEHAYKKFGTFGIAGAFSMYPSHTITLGEGGLIITDDDDFADIARSIHNHGKWRTQDFDFKYIGTNAKLTNLQAAIGCELIGRIDEVNEIRKENIEEYNSRLGNKFYASAPHCYPIYYDSREDRDAALMILKDNNIEARKLMGCVPDYEPYVKLFGKPDDSSFPLSRQSANTGLFLPVHQQLTKRQIKKICDVIKSTRQ